MAAQAGAGRPAFPTGRPVIAGEVLFDVFPDGNEQLGGAPFNVAWNLRGLGDDPYFVSAVGDDERGARVRERMEEWGMDRGGLGVVPGKPTGIGVVTLDKERQPSFDLKLAAWDELGLPERSLSGEEFALLYHGSLAWRSPGSREAIRELRERAGLRVFVDVNIREPWFDPGWVPSLLGNAAWVKLSRDELETIGELPCASDEQMRDCGTRLQSRYGCGGLWITDGAKGSWWLGGDGALHHAATEELARLEDPVGAGDAFSAMAIHGLLRGWEPERILERGNRLAGAVCGIAGATATDRGFYDPFVRPSGGG